MKIGARILKSALAVVICIFYGSFLNENSGFFAAIAAIITMQGTFSDSFIKGKDRVFGTFVGAFFGYIFALLLQGNPFLIGIGIIIIIYICKSLKWNASIVIACVVFLSIMIDGDNILQYSIFRLLDTTAGIIIALLVNYFILPHKPLLAVYNECSELIKDFPSIINQVLNKKEDVDLEEVHEKLIIMKEKASFNEFDLILHQEDEKEVKRLDNVIEGLITIYEHLVFVEELRETESIFIPAKIIGDEPIEEKKLPDIILEFHRQQVLKKWNKVQRLWDERSVKS
jgi:uncharacterized membrane protein YgaE (UPF0421/DUF939 family)